MSNENYTKYLFAIGVPYSVKGEIDPNILPEKAVCLAAPLFYLDAKACSLVFTLLKNNFDLFNDLELSHQISNMTDKLAIAFLGGILDKANKDYFLLSIRNCIKLSHGADSGLIKKTMHLLADHDRLPYDESLQSLFGIKINEITEVDRKKTTPRSALLLRNTHFASRVQKNIFKPKNSVEMTKTMLCDQFISIAEKHQLKQKEVAVLIKATNAQVNEIMNYRVDRFTVDFLIDKTQLLVTNLKNNQIAYEKIDVPLIIKPEAEL